MGEKAVGEEVMVELDSFQEVILDLFSNIIVPYNLLLPNYLPTTCHLKTHNKIDGHPVFREIRATLKNHILPSVDQKDASPTPLLPTVTLIRKISTMNEDCRRHELCELLVRSLV